MTSLPVEPTRSCPRSARYADPTHQVFERDLLNDSAFAVGLINVEFDSLSQDLRRACRVSAYGVLGSPVVVRGRRRQHRERAAMRGARLPVALRRMPKRGR